MAQRSDFSVEVISRKLATWLDAHSSDAMLREAQLLPLRRDMVTLLSYVRDNKVQGTQYSGNMPLKAVREVTAQFVHPPQLDETIGNTTYLLRSEEHVWPLYFLRMIAVVGRLIKTPKGRRWGLTRQGAKFLELNPMLQSAFLLSIWWHRINWLVTCSYTGLGDSLPPHFPCAAYVFISDLPVDEWILFESFADALIRTVGLEWSSPDSSYTRDGMRASIERMVIEPLGDFGAVSRRYLQKPLGKMIIDKLDAFQVTPWGAALMRALPDAVNP